MIRKLVFGCAICPYCKQSNPVFWDGDMKWICINCNEDFKVTYQELIEIEPYRENNLEDRYLVRCLSYNITL